AAASREQDPAPEWWPALVLVARPPEHRRQRLQAVLDNGAPFGITGLLLGQWQPGVTAYVREDGTISATSPGLGEALRGTRMFRLGSDHTADVLTLLHQAEPDAQHHPARSDAEPLPETELEVTAAVQPPVPTHTDLEILGPSHGPAPGARLRPPAAPRRQPTAPLAPEDNEAVDEVVDESVPTGEHATPAVTPSPVPAVAREVDAVPVPITITVLGALRVHGHPEPGATGTDGQEREITGALQPRTRELLVLLALHPDGATREALVSALWGSDPPARPTNALHTALSRMRHAVSTATDAAVTDIVVVGNGRYQLDPVKVRVDYWRFADAVAARRAASTDQARVEAYREVINSYGGPLAEGMSAEWIEPAREAIRRDAIDAVAALARALVEHDPQQTLDLLEVARAFDPHNELLYRDIMRLQERLGQLDAIPRTLTLLTTRLAEIDEVPTPQTRGLAARLGQRHDDTPVPPARSVTPGRRGRSAAG
ncbi:MAG: transcriptional regulator, partial [Actinomycetota bacterium]|nr:transcriptional regulator [Actinomycetota bacterium]